MAKRPRKPRLEQYEAFREASGWYLAAWRDYRNLTLEDLAAEAGTSKGVVSDMETGNQKSNGTKAQRFNRDWIERFARALDCTGGYLIDVNPFVQDPQLAETSAKLRKLAPEDRHMIDGMIDRLLGQDRKSA